MNDEKEFVTTKEAAKIIGMHHCTLQNWRCENKKSDNKKHPDLKYTKVGKKIYYFKKGLLDFIKRNTVGTE